MRVDFCRRWKELPNEALPVLRTLYPYSGWGNQSLKDALRALWRHPGMGQNYQVLPLCQADSDGKEYGVVLMRPSAQSRWYIRAFYCNDDLEARFVSRMCRLVLPLQLLIGAMRDQRRLVSYMMVCAVAVAAFVSLAVIGSPYASRVLFVVGMGSVVAFSASIPWILIVKPLLQEPLKEHEPRWLYDILKAKG